MYTLGNNSDVVVYVTSNIFLFALLASTTTKRATINRIGMYVGQELKLF